MPVALEPVFDPDTLSYTGSIRDADFTLAYTTESPTASVVATLNSASVVTGPNTWASGNNVLELVVTDGDKESTYQVNVVYTPPSARLLGFTTSPTALTPAFDPDVLTYSGATDQDKVTVSYIVEETGASVALTLNGTTINPDTVYTLQVGSNTIVATATHGPSTAVYTAAIVYTPPPSARLTGLTVDPTALTPAFAPDVVAYTGTATQRSFALNWAAEDSAATVTATFNDAAWPNGVSGNLADGYNTFIVSVVNGVSSQNYTVVITYTPTYNAKLTNVAFGGVGQTYTPAFDGDYFGPYTGTTTYESNTVRVFKADAATVNQNIVNGVDRTGQDFPYNIGDNTIQIICTNGTTTETYTFIITRTS